MQRCPRTRPAEVRVGVVDAGIENCYFDSFAVKTRRASPHQGSADERHTGGVVEGMNLDEPNRHNTRQPRKGRDLILSSYNLNAVKGVLKLRQLFRAAILAHRNQGGLFF